MAGALPDIRLKGMDGFMNAQEEGREGEGSRAQEQVGAEEPRTAEAPPAADGERAGPCRPPVATRFRPGQSGNPRGRPRVKRHLGAVVARALRERVTVEETDGRVRRLSKLEATVKQIVDGATKGDPRATRLLFALIKADERALSELRRRAPGSARERGGRDRDRRASAAVCGGRAFARAAFGPGPSPRNRGEANPSLSGKAAGGSPLDEGSRRPSPQPSPRKRGEGEERRPS